MAIYCKTNIGADFWRQNCEGEFQNEKPACYWTKPEKRYCNIAMDCNYCDILNPWKPPDLVQFHYGTQ